LGALSTCRGKISDKEIKVQKNGEKHIMGCFTIFPLSQPLMEWKKSRMSFIGLVACTVKLINA